MKLQYTRISPAVSVRLGCSNAFKYGVFEAMAQRIRGVVKWFSADKGYGFITPENGPDVFVHYSAIQSTGYRKLEAGERVEFEIIDGPKGKQASSVVTV
jgi:CspA family cold shock protein